MHAIDLHLLEIEPVIILEGYYPEIDVYKVLFTFICYFDQWHTIRYLLKEFY